MINYKANHITNIHTLSFTMRTNVSNEAMNIQNAEAQKSTTVI